LEDGPAVLGPSYEVTTDDKLLKKLINELQVMVFGPIDLAALIDERNN